MKKKKKIKANKEKSLTLEEIFNQVALFPPSVVRSNIVLTPLSSEACLAKGINPDVLQRRDFEVFKHDSSDLDIQRLKYESYDRRRHELMEAAMKEKQRLMKSNPRQGAGGENQSNCSEIPSLTPSGILREQEKANATLLELEEKRLQKAREKQKRELLQLLHFEQKMEKIQRDMQLKAEKDAMEEERKKAKKKKQERRQAEERRVRELRRKAREDAEEEIHRINARQRFEKEVQFQKEQEQKEAENKKHTRQLEEERERKRELQRMQIEQQQLKKRLDVEKKLEEREMKERERQIKIEQKRAMDQHELEQKREETCKRIAMNKEAARKHEEQRKKAILDKMTKNQQQQEYISELREREILTSQKEKEALARKREYQAQLAKEREMEMKQFLVQKFHKDEKKVRLIQAMKKKEMNLIKEERDILLQMKRENVERIKRMQEYKRVETMNKISENDKRTEEMLRKKEELAKSRQKNAVEAKIKRDKLMQILEKSKTTGGKAIQKILHQLENNEPFIEEPKKKTIGMLPLSVCSSKSNKKVPTKLSNETKPPSIIEIDPSPNAQTKVTRTCISVSTKQAYVSPYATARSK